MGELLLMPPFVLGLLFIGATFHCGWNLLVKRASEKQVFIWSALAFGSLCFSPLLFFNALFPPFIWLFVLASAAVETTYYVILARAYEHGDFSLVYPLARGTAPALLAVWAMLFLGDRPGLIGLVGIAVIICGLALVGGKSWWQLRKTASVTTSAVALALSVACCISVYSAIDAAAVHHVNPLPFTVAVLGVSAILFTPFIFLYYGYQKVTIEWRVHWRSLIFAGLFMLLSYMLALKSYSLAHISYVGAIREMSIVFAAFIGWRWLGEDFGVIRVVGAVLIFVGILVIAVAG
ncbi:MAG: EamA family transporter [Ktedonobacteraceae bacterium]